jgi:hypothetical protein
MRSQGWSKWCRASNLCLLKQPRYAMVLRNNSLLVTVWYVP